MIRHACGQHTSRISVIRFNPTTEAENKLGKLFNQYWQKEQNDFNEKAKDFVEFSKRVGKVNEFIKSLGTDMYIRGN